MTTEQIHQLVEQTLSSQENTYPRKFCGSQNICCPANLFIACKIRPHGESLVKQLDDMTKITKDDPEVSRLDSQFAQEVAFENCDLEKTVGFDIQDGGPLFDEK